MSAKIHCIATERDRRNQEFRQAVDAMEKPDLMGEFLRFMDRAPGSVYTLPEAENVRYLIAKLLKVSSTEPFRFQLRRSLKTMDDEIAKLRA